MNRLRWGALVMLLAALSACNDEVREPVSDSGVRKASVQVTTDSEGFTTEQRNIMKRLEGDNKPGSIKHIYIVSLYSGDVLLYSPVQGKVTSSGKRLSPVTVEGNNVTTGMLVPIGGETYYTKEVVQDDGTYGSSVEYLYWFNPIDGSYHQQYVTGGMMVHVSDQPMVFPKIVVNLDVEGKAESLEGKLAAPPPPPAEILNQTR